MEKYRYRQHLTRRKTLLKDPTRSVIIDMLLSFSNNGNISITTSRVGSLIYYLLISKYNIQNVYIFQTVISERPHNMNIDVSKFKKKKKNVMMKKIEDQKKY